jgi:hypothetical protein
MYLGKNDVGDQLCRSMQGGHGMKGSAQLMYNMDDVLCICYAEKCREIHFEQNRQLFPYRQGRRTGIRAPAVL